MSGGAKLWCFLLLIPFFLAIGHDLWANYMSTPQQRMRLESFEIDPYAYQGSDIGYLFVAYTPDIYEKTRTLLGEDAWMKWVDPVLRMYTVMFALAPFMLFAVWLLIARVFDLWPFEGGMISYKEKNDRPPNLREIRHQGGNLKYRRH